MQNSSHVSATTQEDFFLNEKMMEMKKGKNPIVIDSTITGAFFSKSLFLVGKEIYDFYQDGRNITVFRGIPLAEFWPFSFLSLRGGYEYTNISFENKKSNGGGFVAGGTLRIFKVDIDFNMTQRHRPVRVLPGYGIDENRYLVSVTKNATFFE